MVKPREPNLMLLYKTIVAEQFIAEICFKYTAANCI